MKQKLLLFTFILLAAIPLSANKFSYTNKGQTLKYRVIDVYEKTCEVVENSNISGSVIIPTVANGYKVTAIGYDAFHGCSGLTSVTIPNSVTTIGAEAFMDCSGLTSITIPNSVTSIGGSTFHGCSGLTSVTIPSSVTTIGSYAFSGCSGLTSVTIPNSVTSIGNLAFSGCSGLTSVTIPNSVTTIGVGAFQDCNKLTSVTIPNSVTEIPQQAFKDCSGLTSVTIPNSVTTIGSYAFENCTGLTSVTIPNSVTSIGSDAFTGCSGLKEFIIEDGNTELKFFPSPFDGAPISSLYIGRNWTGMTFPQTLTDLTLGEGVTSIPDNAFERYSNLKTVTISNSVTTIGNSAFKGCSGLTSITIPNSVTSIGGSTFNGCSGLTSLTIPNSVTTISEYAFSGCNGLTSLTIPNSVTTISEYAFSGCSGLTSLTIPNSVTTISRYAFSGCSGLTSIIIPTSINSINDGVFSNCSGLTSVTIPNSVTTIENGAFSGCSSLTEFVIEDGDSELSFAYYYALDSAPISKLYIGRNWKGITFPKTLTDLTLGESVTKIPDTAFSSCSGLASVTIPNSVTTIGEWAFSDCSGLTSVTIPTSVTTIGAQAFKDCSGLTSVTIGNSVTQIGNSAFNGCSGLTSVTIGNSVTTIGGGAFGGCISLASITIPNSVTTIGELAFSGCSGLTSLEIPNSVNNIGNSAYANCSNLAEITLKDSHSTLRFGENVFGNSNNIESVYVGRNFVYNGTYTDCGPFYNKSKLTNVTLSDSVSVIFAGAFQFCKEINECRIPNSITTIGNFAFYECTGLTNIEIPNSVTTIGKWAFYNCTGLKTAIIGGLVSSMGEDVFKGCSGLIKSAYPGQLRNPFNEGIAVAYPANEEVIIEKGWVYNKDKTAIYFAPYSLEGNCVISESIKIIGNSAFSGCGGLTSIDIPNSVTAIGESAFLNCNSLKNVKIGNGVNRVNSSCFSGCSELTDITLKDGHNVLQFEDNAFASSDKIESVYVGRNFENTPFSEKIAVKNVAFSDSVTTIPSNAFKNCSNIGIIHLPDSVTTIGDYAFSGCSGIASLKLPDSVTTIGNYAFSGCSRIASLKLPDSVTTIGDYAFSGCSGIASVTIPNSANIGNYAFSNCNGLKSVLIAPHVRSANNAFNGCKLIKLLTSDLLDANNFVNISVDYYATYAFDKFYIANYCLYNLDNTTVEYVPCDIDDNYSMPETIERIGALAFTGCAKLTALTIPASVKSIDDYAFEGCSSLKTLKADPADVPVVENEGGMSALYSETQLIVPTESGIDYASTFPWSNFGSVKMADGKEILSGNDEIFNYRYRTDTKEATLVSCRNRSMPIVNIPRRVVLGVDGDESFYNVVKISDLAFQNHQMQSVTIGDNIREIGKSAFEKCANLNEIVFGKNIEIIGEHAFSECTGLTELNFNDNLKYIAQRAFAKCSDLHRVKFNEALDSIGEEAFIESFTSYGINLEFNRNLKYIGPNAFASSGVRKIESKGGVEKIDRSAFFNCDHLYEIDFEDGLKFIGDSAFARCRAIKNITLPSTLEEIGEFAFSNMYEHEERISEYFNYDYNKPSTFPEDDKYMVSINIPASVKHIGMGAFSTTPIKKVNIESLEAWCNILFEDKYSNPMIYCSAPMTVNNKEITDLVIPDNITKIKANAFICNNFNSITIPQDVMLIEDNAFLSQCKMVTERKTYPEWDWHRKYEYYYYDRDEYIQRSIPRFVVEDGVNEIEFGRLSFSLSSPTEIYLGRNINGRIGNSSLTTLKIGDYVTEIPDEFCLLATNLRNLSFGSSIKSIGKSAFVSSRVTELKFPASLETIGDGAFAGSSVSYIKLPALLKSIGDYAFSGSRLTGVVIPPSVESIGFSAFYNSNLKTVAIGCGIKEIGEMAFANNNNISDVYVTALTPPMANNNTFSNYNPTLHVPAAVKNDYIDFPRCWYRFENQVSDLALAERVETDVTQINDAKPGDTYQLTAQVYPAQALQHIFWQSTNPAIAMVDLDGKVTIRDPESAPAVRITPTVTATPGSTAACEIHAYTMYAHGPVAVVKIYGDLSGVEDIVAGDIDDNAPVEVYNLNGYKVGDSIEGLEPGFYIVRQGSRAKKVYIQ